MTQVPEKFSIFKSILNIQLIKLNIWMRVQVLSTQSEIFSFLKWVFKSEFKYTKHSLFSSQSEIFKKLIWVFESEFKYNKNDLFSSQSERNHF